MPLSEAALAGLPGLQGASVRLASALRADSVWTEIVTAPDRPSVLSVEAADALIARFQDLHEGIDGAISAGEQIALIVERATQADPALREWPVSLGDALESAGSVDALDALRYADNSLARLAAQGWEGMRESRGEAMTMLLADLQGVLCSAPVQGYLPPRFLCGLAKASMAAGLVTVWVPPHAHAAAAVGLGGAVYKAAKCGKTPATAS